MDSKHLSFGRFAITAKHGAVLGGIALSATLLAACGGGSSSPSAAGATASSSSSGAAGFSAYETCLKQHGVTLPSFSARPRPSGTGGTRGGGFGGGGGGGGFGFGGASADPSMQAALAACASDRPSGAAGFGGGGFGAGGTALTAFRNCMTQQGEPVPTTRPTSFPTARPTASATSTGPNLSRYLGGLNPSDPKVAAALNVCKALIPSPSARASASG